MLVSSFLSIFFFNKLWFGVFCMLISSFLQICSVKFFHTFSNFRKMSDFITFLLLLSFFSSKWRQIFCGCYRLSISFSVHSNIFIKIVGSKHSNFEHFLKKRIIFFFILSVVKMLQISSDLYRCSKFKKKDFLKFCYKNVD